jgi:hypothetical protein
MFIRRVSGNSMKPNLSNGDIVLGWRRQLVSGAVIVFQRKTEVFVKRISKIGGDAAYVVGDNIEDSHDSRHFGKIAKSDIIGTVMIVLPKAVNPPRLVKSYGVWLGRVSALILVAMVLVHLFRIDSFIPALDGILPGAHTAATFFGLAIIFVELFSIPFVLRMKLSPLAHIVSGALVVIAPLLWVLVDVWSYGLGASTGQLNTFVALPSTTPVIMINILWLVFNYLALYSLGYNNIKLPRLKKST